MEKVSSNLLAKIHSVAKSIKELFVWSLNYVSSK